MLKSRRVVGLTSAQPTSHTPYGAVNTLVLLLLAKVQTILREKLAGFYLCGSLSLGDFDPQSSAVVSKPEAAAWARQTLDPKWRPVIERALIWRHQHEKDDLTATLDFIRFAIMYAEEACG